MSKEEENMPDSGRQGLPQPEIPPAVSERQQSLGPELSTSRLTEENVKKLQDDYPVAKSSLTRQSVEAYLQQSNRVKWVGREASRKGRKEPGLPDEKESEGTSASPLREETAENYSEPTEVMSIQDFRSQTRSPTSSVPETKKREFADLETQTEWSYSDTSLLGFSGKARRRTLIRDDLEQEVEHVKSEYSSGTMMESLFESEDHSVTDFCCTGCCEFCAAALRPFPTAEELDEKPEKIESVPCCRTYRDILQCVVQELMEAQAPEGTIDIMPHPRLSQTVMNSRTKTNLMQELQSRGVESYKDIFQQYMNFGPYLKVAFTFSNYPPIPKPAAVKKRPRPRAKELLKIDVDFKPEQLKMCHSATPVKRYYPNGNLFFLLLPDGTGQVYYPSGNIAILITYLKDTQFTYIVLSDGPYNRLIAFFTNQGYAACDYPDGNIWVNLHLCYGCLFDKERIQRKLWNWWDTSRHIHAPPFQPIVMRFNIYIQVRIEAQDRIFLTFTKLHNCIRLNVGAKLKLKDPATLSLLQSSEKWRPLISQAKMLRIKTLLAKMRKGLTKTDSLPLQRPKDLHGVTLMLWCIQRWQRSALGQRKPSETSEASEADASDASPSS